MLTREDLFEGVFYVVEATDREQLALWSDWFYRPVSHISKIKLWNCLQSGKLITIGELYDRPIVLQIDYAILNGKRIVFYSPCSELVDYKMIDEWFDAHRTTWNKTNASNFAHCVAAVSKE